MRSYPALSIAGMSREARRAFVLMDPVERFTRFHGDGSGSLTGMYVLVFATRGSRIAFLKSTRDLEDIRSHCRDVVVSKLEYEVEKSGVLSREDAGWYIPYVLDSAITPSLKELHEKVERHGRGGTIMDFYMIIYVLSEAIQNSKCSGIQNCAVHASIAHTVNRAVQMAIDASLPKHAVEIMRRGVLAMDSCVFPSSHASSAWFLWLSFSCVCPGWDSQQVGEFKKYSQAVENYARAARTPADLINAAWLHYNIAAFCCYSVFPGMALRGLIHLNGILALEEKCLQHREGMKEYRCAKVLAQQLISFAPRLEMYRAGLFNEIVKQTDLNDTSRVSHMRISIRGLSIFPSKLGKNGKPRALKFFHDGICYQAVQLVGEDDNGNILQGDTCLPTPSIEFLMMDFQHQLSLFDEEYERYNRQNSDKKPSIRVLPEFGYNADTDLGVKCKGKFGRPRKAKQKSSKRDKAEEKGKKDEGKI